jgi:hypothetical protein
MTVKGSALADQLSVRPAWHDQAACRWTRYPDRFFSGSAPEQRKALAICAPCPVKDACLAAAVEAGSAGVCGGTTHLQRLLMAAGPVSCREGHELTEETAQVRQVGARYRLDCLVCLRDRSALLRARKAVAA